MNETHLFVFTPSLMALAESTRETESLPRHAILSTRFFESKGATSWGSALGGRTDQMTFRVQGHLQYAVYDRCFILNVYQSPIEMEII